jgi:hypothetical protein
MAEAARRCASSVVRVDGHVGERGRRKTSPRRVVERQIEPPERLDRPLHELPNRIGVPDIGRNGDRAPAGGVDRRRKLRQLVLAPRSEGDRSACVSERSCGCGAYPTTRAGDDRDLAAQGRIDLVRTVGHHLRLLGWSLPGHDHGLTTTA